MSRREFSLVFLLVLLTGSRLIARDVYAGGNEQRHCRDSGRFSEWSVPVNLGPSINTADNEFHMAISANQLNVFFATDRPGGFGMYDLWVAERPDRHADWGPAQNLGPTINTSGLEVGVALPSDEHWLFFGSNGHGGFGGLDIFASYRKDTSDNFGWEAPVNLGDGVNSEFGDSDETFFIDPETGALTMYFASIRPGLGDWDIYTSTVGDDGTFGPASLVLELSSPRRDAHPTISRDGLEIFLASNRDGSFGGIDLWVSTRPTTHDPWSTPVNLGPTINTVDDERAPYLSADGRWLYFTSNRPGGFGGDDFYVTRRHRLQHYEFARFDVPGSTSTNLNAGGINDSGQIVGQYDDARGRHGYLRSDNLYQTLDVPDSTVTSANGISDRGQIVGNYTAGGIRHGFLLSDDEYITLDPPGSGATEARAINSSGEIVGWYLADGTTHGFLLRDGNYTTFDAPGSTFTAIQGVNDVGDIVGRYDDADSIRHGFVLDGHSFRELDAPGSHLTAVFGINDSGDIVGSYVDDRGRHGFLLSDDEYTTLDPPESTAEGTFAWAINDCGQIVGTYADADGTAHGFLATPIPESR